MYGAGMALSDEEVDRIAAAMAPKLVHKVRSEHHDFWIDAETHYLAHEWMDRFRKAIEDEEVYDLKQLVSMYRMTRSLWVKAFLGAAIVGTLVLAAFGLGLSR